MLTKKTNIKRGVSKTLLIILGVIIALLMTLSSPLFAADDLMTVAQKNATKAKLAETTPPSTDTQVDLNENLKLQSSARLFQIFTKNLPYLNTK